MPDNACTLVPTVFRWHAKMEFKFHFYFSFSRDIEKQIWISLFVFRFRLNFEKPIWTSFLVFALLWKTDLNFVFRFCMACYWKTDLNFVCRFCMTWKTDLCTSPVIWGPRTCTPSGLTGAFTFYASESKWILLSLGPKWEVNSPPPPPPHDMSYKHGTPFFNKGWLVIRWQPRKKPVSVKRRLRTRGKMQRECKMLTADWE